MQLYLNHETLLCSCTHRGTACWSLTFSEGVAKREQGHVQLSQRINPAINVAGNGIMHFLVSVTFSGLVLLVTAISTVDK
ncbi:hypothetical protein Lalb_Chr16g0381751 [Lupinus albus]|uniref:Uncharacterized protein n=1 Tax=Lupinus albus TaxID=3870 RepID=A0A6A4PAL8_LUPAL|nr:hypothetical protein Lalb_Chr16g0381751 [Lupinus albus]